MTTILALDTSTRHCSVALKQGDETLLHEADTPQSHARNILPMVQAVLDEAGISPRAVDVIAFGEGPGAFTGLRIAAATAQGLAFGWDRPVLTVSTLAALAWQAAQAGHAAPCMAVLDARMGELYAAVFDESVKMRETPSLITPEEAHQWLSRHEIATVVGQPGDHRALFDGVPLVEMPPRADAVAALAAEKVAQARRLSEQVPLPVYLRDKVADKPVRR